MIPHEWRMRKAQDFSQSMRQGACGSHKYLAVHFLTDQHGSSQPGLIGFVISKRSIPHAVDRNRLKRQLRHIARELIDSQDIVSGNKVVIRVRNSALNRTYDELRCACIKALHKAQKRYVTEHMHVDENLQDDTAQSRG